MALTLSGSNGVTGNTGAILQVVQATYSTYVSVGTTYTDSGLSCSITPTSTSSKILVLVTHAARIFMNASGERQGQLKLVRGATDIYENTYAIQLNATVGASSYMGVGGTCTVNYLDSPATTSAVTYKTQGKINSSANGASMDFQTNSHPSVMILMEVAG